VQLVLLALTAQMAQMDLSVQLAQWVPPEHLVLLAQLVLLALKVQPVHPDNR
jgi:hypothetical protein